MYNHARGGTGAIRSIHMRRTFLNRKLDSINQQKRTALALTSPAGVEWVFVQRNLQACLLEFEITAGI
jgi:hypothetical protein